MSPETSTQLVTYNVTEAQIAATRDKCASLAADTPGGYEDVRVAISSLRDTRGAIERRRVELKADALAWGRSVDSEAKRFTTLLLDIEEPLKAKKAAIDDEKARIKAEADAVKLAALQEEIRVNQERQEAERKAERDAEEARIAAERAALDAERAALAEERRVADAKAAEERAVVEAAQRAERDRLEAERAKLAEDRRREEERQRAERDAIEADRRAIDAERVRAERAEFERQATIKAEADAKAKAEQDQIDTLEREKRLNALLPDLEKVRAFAAAIRAVPTPAVKSKRVAATITAAVAELARVAADLDAAARTVKEAA